MTLKAHIFFHFFFFLFLFEFQGKWKREKAYFFSSFSFSFVSFLLLFTLFFDFGVGNGREIEKKISFFSSFFNSLFWKRNKGATGNFEGNSSSFSFLFSLFFLSFNPSSFQFLGKEMEIWEDKNECPKHANPFLQEHLLSLQNQFIVF